MYPKYFGLKEPSFSIAPDPHYLFLSEQHREALAHLLYGAGESGGFVLLTGEVGTGKTTVCRAFLEQLPEGVDVALILNPTQTANELLLNLCDEFRIPVPEGTQSIKVLVDRLNQYLLEAHGQGRRPVLIVDEAQNLQPQVLEQIRLLTNLETTKHKLLQIFLIGQPELRRLLDSEQLRQLNQRITARFHLAPFNLRETGDYIRHRIAVAGVDRPLFTARAIRRIYRYSGGIPRLVNILCDRALLGACVTRGSQVTPVIVDKAAREVRGGTLDATRPPAARPAFLAAAAFALALGAGWWGAAWLGDENGAPFGWVSALFPPQVGDRSLAPASESAARQEPPTETATEVATAEPTPVTTSVSPSEPAPLAVATGEPQASGEALPRIALMRFEADAVEATLDRLAMSEDAALRLLLRRWTLEPEALGAGDPCARLASVGLRCEQETGTLGNLRYFDLPAVLRVVGPGDSRRFVVLAALDDTEATLDLATGSERVPVAGLERIWTGHYTLVWQPPPGGSTLMASGSWGEDVRWLRRTLSQVPGLDLATGDAPRFDASLSDALRTFQTSRGLSADGVAGPRTLILLNQAVERPGIPRLDGTTAVPEPVVETP
ncbi:ExeA family protein [Thiocystis violascens]|uniref:Type II secretory pathway, component ExeA (Predicted ATPase) n=1 Tax=Thiocystis violascens (strain ATCC 17096 / DSM 198 / 6111) TaxID=765911 RepID=I3YBL1_THIV6|nr:AAA family ATPase [Thiocystis violascens]AFL74379.1 type II secretory pathway, component ExeA (predicted ATPase) [Thiocystis violascens DSM 198]